MRHLHRKYRCMAVAACCCCTMILALAMLALPTSWTASPTESDANRVQSEKPTPDDDAASRDPLQTPLLTLFTVRRIFDRGDGGVRQGAAPRSLHASTPIDASRHWRRRRTLCSSLYGATSGGYQRNRTGAAFVVDFLSGPRMDRIPQTVVAPTAPSYAFRVRAHDHDPHDVDVRQFMEALIYGACTVEQSSLVGVLIVASESAPNKRKASQQHAEEAVALETVMGMVLEATPVGGDKGAHQGAQASSAAPPSGRWATRTWIGQSMVRTSAERSCEMRNRHPVAAAPTGYREEIKQDPTAAAAGVPRRRDGVRRMSAFQVVEPTTTLPMFLSEDLVWFLLEFYASHILRTFDELDALASLAEKSTSDVQEAAVLTHVADAAPTLGACGLPSSMWRRLLESTMGANSPSQPVAGGTGRPPKTLALQECIALFFSGRDVQRFTWERWNKRKTQHGQHPHRDVVASEVNHSLDWMQTLARTSHHSLLAREQMPYVWMAEDVSHGRTATTELASGGLPWRDDDHDEVRFVPVVSVDLHVGDAADTAPDAAEGDNGVLAAVYVPTRIDQFRMRDMIRCYYRSLDVGVRARLPLHFLLGARATMDSRFVFRGRGSAAAVSYQDPRNDASVWHRLLAENCSTDFERRGVDAAAAGGGGDLLLLDVIDLDGAPYTTESEAVRARGVRRAMETLRAPPARTAKAWHHNSEISAMLIKLLVGMVHMVRMHPTSQFFVRGADDAYVSFQRVYLDVVDAVKRHNQHKTAIVEKRNWLPAMSSPSDEGTMLKPTRTFLGHVTQNVMIMRCGLSEIAAHGILSTSGAVAPVRVAMAPAAYPEYVTGGGSVMSRDVVSWIASSIAVVVPHVWIEEDVALGRLTAPVVLPKKSFRFHNFFNATKDVDWAFHGRVPRAYQYCDARSWVVHKYPPSASALRWVDSRALAMYCNEQDFEAAVVVAPSARGATRGGHTAESGGVQHVCWQTLEDRFHVGMNATTHATLSSGGGARGGGGGGGWPSWHVESKYLRNVTKLKYRRNRHAKTFGPPTSSWHQAYARHACDPEEVGNFLQYMPRFQCG